MQVNPDADRDAARYGVFSKHHALIVDCACGQHLLEAQIDFTGDGDSLVGIYAAGTLTKKQIDDKKNPLPNFHARVRKIAAHVDHPDNWVNLRRLSKLPDDVIDLVNYQWGVELAEKGVCLSELREDMPVSYGRKDVMRGYRDAWHRRGYAQPPE